MDDHDNELVIVAIPAENDHVWKVSSETVPHMTILYLGEANYTPNQLAHVTEYVEHAASLLKRFGMDVDRRGKLGPKDADVLFFEKTYDYDKLVKFRSNLLQDPLISKAYLSASQFPEWTPHLTLGFPDNPAFADTREHPGFSWVNFDRIALWVGDSVGPTFDLKGWGGELNDMMQSQEAIEDFLEHYGVKGMKWGVKKAAIKTARSPEAVKTASIKAKAKKTRVSSLTNEELQTAITRMNLEKQFTTLNPNKSVIARGSRAVKALLGVGRTANEVVAFNNSPAGQILRENINKAKAK